MVWKVEGWEEGGNLVVLGQPFKGNVSGKSNVIPAGLPCPPKFTVKGSVIAIVMNTEC